MGCELVCGLLLWLRTGARGWPFVIQKAGKRPEGKEPSRFHWTGGFWKAGPYLITIPRLISNALFAHGRKAATPLHHLNPCASCAFWFLISRTIISSWHLGAALKHTVGVRNSMFIPDPVALAGLIWLQMLKLGPRIGEACHGSLGVKEKDLTVNWREALTPSRLKEREPEWLRHK